MCIYIPVWVHVSTWAYDCVHMCVCTYVLGAGVKAEYFTGCPFSAMSRNSKSQVSFPAKTPLPHWGLVWWCVYSDAKIWAPRDELNNVV